MVIRVFKIQRLFLSILGFRTTNRFVKVIIGHSS
jgi:hypothetical protein